MARFTGVLEDGRIAFWLASEARTRNHGFNCVLKHFFVQLPAEPNTAPRAVTPSRRWVSAPNVATTHGHGGRDVFSFRIKNKSPPRQRKNSVTITKESGSLLYLFSWPFSLCRSFLPSNRKVALFCKWIMYNSHQAFFRVKLNSPIHPPLPRLGQPKHIPLGHFWPMCTSR